MMTRIRFGGTVVTNDFWKELVAKAMKSLKAKRGPAEFR